MFIKRKPPERTGLDDIIDMVQSEMQSVMAETKEFAKMTKQLTQLYEIKEKQNSTDRLSKDTVLIVCGNLLGILIIVHYEKTEIVTSKALGFLGKLR